MKKNPNDPSDNIPSRNDDRPDVVSINIPFNDSIAMEKFQEAMDEMADAHGVYVQRLALEFDCSIDCASDVAYLRTRSRWTEELEKRLIELHKHGTPPNIFDWP